MKKKTELTVKIQSLLNELETPAERIDLIERIGKKIRRANSIETSKEINKFNIKMNVRINVDDYPV